MHSVKFLFDFIVPRWFKKKPKPTRINAYTLYRETHSDTWWTLREGIMNISEMSTQHILNSIALLERIDQTYTKAYEGLTTELAYRRSLEK